MERGYTLFIIYRGSGKRKTENGKVREHRRTQEGIGKHRKAYRD